ncbi:MAG: glycosyltransferase family 2 protein [Deltaproteobacteria bacterium]|nr:glycosyltransferase family 2 protein [Deltaproteobacteria bacterium]
MIDVSIILPCLNEAETVANCINKAKVCLDKSSFSYEVILADNGSTDGSVEIAKNLGVRIIKVPEKGYGAAILAGLKNAEGQFIVIADSDDSYDLGIANLFIETLADGHDLVLGCRFPKLGGEIIPGAMPHLHRYVGTPILSWLVRILFKTDIADINCGYRGLQKSFSEKLDLKSSGMEFASEMIVKAVLLKGRMKQIPITLHPDGRKNSQSHLKPFRDGLRHVSLILKFFFRNPVKH